MPTGRDASVRSIVHEPGYDLTVVPGLEGGNEGFVAAAVEEAVWLRSRRHVRATK